MRSLLRGFAYLSRRPKLWAYAWGPLIVTVIIYVALLVVAQVSLLPLIERLTPDHTVLERMPIIGGIAIFLLWLISANFVIIAITSLFSGLLWGRLSLTVERDIYGDAPDTRLGCLPQIKDVMWRFAQAVIFIIAIIAFGWLGIIASVAATGILGVIEFSAPAYARRGVLYPAQLKVCKLPAAFGFALGSGLLSLLPLIFVLAMPALVVGATIMCREADPKS